MIFLKIAVSTFQFGMIQIGWKSICGRFSTAAQNVKVPLSQYKTHGLDPTGHILPILTETNKEECFNYYKHMAIMRKMEIACDFLYKNKEIRGFCHLYDGQEAIPEGMEAALTFDDPIIAGYRIHCQAYKRGYSVRQIMAEMLGRDTGATRGKGGSMHYYHKKNNFYGGNGIVGAQVPVGAGIAFSLKYEKKQNICIAMFGDGAANQGQIFEAANMAKLWKLPLVLLCENNKYGMGTSVERSSMNPNFYTRGDVIAGVRVDGNDVFAVREVMKWAKSYCLDKGPLFMEMMTYRYHGHSMSDAGTTYRTRDEVVERRRSTDPLVRLGKIIVQNKFGTQEDLARIEDQAKKHVDEEVNLALSDPPVDNREINKHVYLDNEFHYKRGVLYDDSYIPPEQKY